MTRWNELGGTVVAKPITDKQGEKEKQFIWVRLGDNGCKGLWGRCLATKNDGGSFGGTELPTESKSKRAGLLMEGL